MKSVKVIVEEIARGREEFMIPYDIYNSLDIEVQKELDRNYWRFPIGSKGYLFDEMDAEAKAHFAGEDMVIHRSIFERI